jgi:DNA polymerase elongation subunit (family B)
MDDENTIITFPRKEVPCIDPDVDDVLFQVIDWYMPESDRATQHYQRIEGYGSSNDDPEEYKIFIHGVTKEGHTVCLQVNNFCPYFFLKIPSQWVNLNDRQLKEKVRTLETKLRFEKSTKRKYNSTEEYTSNIIPYKLREHLEYVKIVKRKNFWGFTNGKEYPFIKIRMKSLALFNALKRHFSDDAQIKEGFALYESNIDPFLRFIHERNIQPCGWIKIPAKTYDFLEDGEDGPISRAGYNIGADYSSVYGCNINQIAPLMVVSFDIECTSSHGDFPVAKKNYGKLTMDLLAASKFTQNINEDKVIEWLMTVFQKEIVINIDVTIHRVFPKVKSTPVVLEKIIRRCSQKILEILCDGKTFQDDDDDGEPDATEDDTKPKRKKNNDTSNEEKLLTILDTYLPKLKGDPLIQIGTTVNRYGSDEIIYKHIVTLNSCDEIPGVDVESCDNEADVIKTWKDLIVRLDPDILTGYNIFGFDAKYIWDRVEELNIDEEFLVGLGRLKSRRTILDRKELSSSALGDNIMFFFDMDGVVQIDLLKVMQRDHKLDSYKLDAVAKHFLKDQKDDLKPREIFEKFLGNSTDRAVIAKYCIQDCALCNRLMYKLKVLENNVAMGNVCSVPLNYLFMRGQGIKIFSLVSKECRAKQYLIPVLKVGGWQPREKLGDDIPEEDGYEGAIVLPPQEGMYLDDPITVLDYSSLYPSSMISRNLSHDSYVEPNSEFANLHDQGITYHTITYDVYEGKGDAKHVVGNKSCVFAQFPNGKKGIIPSILMKLLQQRKNTRKKIEYESLITNDDRCVSGIVKDLNDESFEVFDVEENIKTIIQKSTVIERKDTYNQFEKAVLDALQVAFKVTANSLYGQIGSKMSQIYLKDIAACTTATGREMIMTAKSFVEKQYNAEVIYGDSVMPYTPITIKLKNGNIKVTTIDAIATLWEKYPQFKAGENDRSDKERADMTDVMVWTHKGWSNIRRVIRHKTTKKIYRILTHTGLVDVTEDHSLLREDESLIKPSELAVKQTLLHSQIKWNGNIDLISEEQAYIYGMFVGDGSCDTYNYKLGAKYSWAINNSNMELLIKCKAILESIENSSFKILMTLESSGVYKLVSCGGGYGFTKRLVHSYRSKCYVGQSKVIPLEVQNGSLAVLESFRKGLFDSDGNRKENAKFGCLRFDTKNQVSAQTYVLLLQKLGYNTSLNTRKDKPNIFRITYTKARQRKNPIAIKKIEVLHDKYTGYVYDLETEEGVFHAGIGNLIVKNTDSIFCKFPVTNEKGEKVYGREALPLCIAVGQKASREIKSILPPPQCLEYEKTMWPFILLSKKRYVGNLYEDDAEKKPKQKSMGIVLKRRDNAHIVKKIYGGIIDILLNKNDFEQSVIFLQNSLQEMVNGNIDLDDLIISKTLKGSYKDPTKIAHKVLASRIGERDAGNKPMVNDRVPYIYISLPEGKIAKLQGDRIEHPDYIREMNLKPDYLFYITNQLMKPICQLFALCVENLPGYNYPPEYWVQWDEDLSGKTLYTNEKKRKDRISALKMKEVEDLMFLPFMLQLGGGVKAKRAAVPKKPKLTAVSDTLPELTLNEQSLIIEIQTTQITKGKNSKYESTAIIKSPDESVLKEYKFEIKGVKQTSLIQTCEKTLQAILKDFSEMKGNPICIRIDRTFIKTLRDAYAIADTIQEDLRKAIQEQDMGKLVELQKYQATANILGYFDIFPFVLQSI